MIEGIKGTEEWIAEWRSKADERVGLLLQSLIYLFKLFFVLHELN